MFRYFDGIVNIQDMPTSYSILAPSFLSLVVKIHRLFVLSTRDYSTWHTLSSIVRLWPTISLCDVLVFIAIPIIAYIPITSYCQ
jgi:hypothetical protein